MDPRTQQQPTTENRSSEAGTSPTVSIACFHYSSIDRVLIIEFNSPTIAQVVLFCALEIQIRFDYDFSYSLIFRTVCGTAEKANFKAT